MNRSTLPRLSIDHRRRIRFWRDELLRSGQEVPVLLPGWHGVDDHLVAALEDEDDGLKQARLGVEAEPQLATRPVIVFDRLYPERPVG